MTPRLLLALGAPVLSVVLLGGCGSDSDTAADDTASPSSSDSTPADPASSTSDDMSAGGFPDCAAVWKKGATLAEDYLGCQDDGAVVEADGLACESGQFIVTYDDRFWAVAGGPVTVTSGPLLKDKTYKRTLASCRG